MSKKKEFNAIRTIIHYGTYHAPPEVIQLKKTVHKPNEDTIEWCCELFKSFYHEYCDFNGANGGIELENSPSSVLYGPTCGHPVGTQQDSIHQLAIIKDPEETTISYEKVYHPITAKKYGISKSFDIVKVTNEYFNIKPETSLRPTTMDKSKDVTFNKTLKKGHPDDLLTLEQFKEILKTNPHAKCNCSIIDGTHWMHVHKQDHTKD